MFMLAMRSIGQRPGRFLATLLAAFLGAGIIMTFNSLYDTAGRPGVDPVSSDTLTTSASVVGGYGTLLVFFAVASTLTVNVRQRAGELELLRCSGATPGPIRATARSTTPSAPSRCCRVSTSRWSPRRAPPSSPYGGPRAHANRAAGRGRSSRTRLSAPVPCR